MGCLNSKPDIEVPPEEKKIKLLLLGTGESGKSTFTKQLKIIHLNGYNEKEREEYKSAIINNVIFCMRSLISGAQSLGIEIEAKDDVTEVVKPEYDILSNNFPDGLVAHIKTLWADPGIQAAFKRQSEFQLFDSAKYFFDEIDRISKSDYIPTQEDVLRVRVKTTGITEIEFTAEQTKFLVVDVGGQRNERRKWLNCFDNVDAILFIVALSEYDLKCFEDSTTNRMMESIKIFSDIVNSECFENISIILFLNKVDLFDQKIKETPITVCFPDYDKDKDPNDPKEVKEFIKEQFLKESKNTQKTIVTHVICATDTDLVRTIFDSVRSILVKNYIGNETV